MPSTISSSVSSDLASSTVMTPSLPTFFIASASIRPISLSPLAEIVPTCAISSLVETFFERLAMSATIAATARSMPRRRSIGFMPAATARTPSCTSAWARIVAVVVPSPASVLVLLATSLTIWAPMFSNLSDRLDFLGDGHPILGDPRRAVRFIEDDVATLGAERHPDRMGQRIDAAQHALARIAAQANIFCRHNYRLLQLAMTPRMSGREMPPAVFSTGSIGRTVARSCRDRNVTEISPWMQVRPEPTRPRSDRWRSPQRHFAVPLYGVPPIVHNRNSAATAFCRPCFSQKVQLDQSF